VENKCTSHKFIRCAISVPKIIKVGGNLTKLWQKQFGTVFETRCSARLSYIEIAHNNNKSALSNIDIAQPQARSMSYDNMFIYDRVYAIT